jgi:hypothetical protein
MQLNKYHVAKYQPMDKSLNILEFLKHQEWLERFYILIQIQVL